MHFTFQIAVSVQYHAVGSRYSNYLVCGASWERCNFTFNSSFLPQKARCSRLRCAGAGGSTRRPLDAAPRMRAPAASPAPCKQTAEFARECVHVPECVCATDLWFSDQWIGCGALPAPPDEEISLGASTRLPCSSTPGSYLNGNYSMHNYLPIVGTTVLLFVKQFVREVQSHQAVRMWPV